MEVAESGGWDFLDWRGPDTSACVFHRLDDPTDLARAAAVSRSWRQFVIANQFCKSLCLRICPEVASFTRAVEVSKSPPVPALAAPASRSSHDAEKDHRTYSNLGGALVSSKSKPFVDCILDCIGASTTTVSRPRGWRTRSIHTGGGGSPFILLVERGPPIFSSKMVRARIGGSKPSRGLAEVDNQTVIADENYVWTYASPDIPMRQCLFYLPMVEQISLNGIGAVCKKGNQVHNKLVQRCLVLGNRIIWDMVIKGFNQVQDQATYIGLPMQVAICGVWLGLDDSNPAQNLDKVRKPVDRLVPLPVIQKRRKKAAPSGSLPRRSRRVAGAAPCSPGPVLSVTQMRVMRQLGFEEREIIQPEAQDIYSKLFGPLLSDSHVCALAAIFGWEVGTVWNVRGLNNRDRRNSIRDVVISSNADIICLQETKVANMSQHLLLSICGSAYDNFIALPANGTRCAIASRIDTYSTLAHLRARGS
ncbi:unnamed protein product [Miscanthus lutarioriparius]|uniref:Uncharacterized protein n=1 Tax=Miscanthus lutarioriparius TaxID=422564 RepID=A0A811P0U5_9POAL|nr:unnamed protein product [Miscanthus lutarioriparius]